jgi:hypothetical protein
MTLSANNVELVAVRFICTACSDLVEAKMHFHYEQSIQYRGEWILLTEIERTPGQAACPKCSTINPNAWTTYHEDKSWISRRKWK